MSAQVIVILLVSVATWLVAGRIWLSLWQSSESLVFKVLGSIVTLIPLVGPFLFYFYKMPPRAPVELQQIDRNYYGASRPLGPYQPGGPRSADRASDDSPAIPTLRKLRPVHHTALVIAAVLLAMHWLIAIQLVMEGDPWGYRNAFGLTVGTFSLVAVLTAGTVTWVTLVARFWILPAVRATGLVPNNALGADAPGTSRPLRSKGRSGLRRAGQRET